VVLFASFGSLFTGYSLAVFAFTIGQPTFYSSLGLEQNPATPGYSYTNDIIGASNGIFLALNSSAVFWPHGLATDSDEAMVSVSPPLPESLVEYSNAHRNHQGWFAHHFSG